MVCLVNTNKPNLIQASKRNKDTVDALTMEDLEKRVEIKRSKILVQSSRQEDIFYEIKRTMGINIHAIAKTIDQLNYAHTFT